MNCKCYECEFRGMGICDKVCLEADRDNWRKQALQENANLEYCKQHNAALRLELAINQQFLADIAGVLYDHDLHKEEDEVLELLRMNKDFLN